MSGHSKFANIKHKKEKNDAAKGKVFTIIGREIAVAVKEGGPDPANNYKLAQIIAKAKSNNMPNDTIERGIKKASGELGNVNYEYCTYEGYGPSGTAIIVKCLTDNKNRTASNVRNAFTKGYGSIGTQGCVSYMFDEKGQILIDKEECDMDADELMMIALDAGAEDFNEEEDSFEVLTAPEDFDTVHKALEEAKIPMAQAEVSMIPQTYVTLTDETDLKNINKILDLLDAEDDVQEVYHNWDEQNPIFKEVIMKRILFAASECVPFIKTGGLADVCGALPKEFDKEYWDVRVVIPNYSCIPEHFRNQMEYVTHFYMGAGRYIPSKYVGVLQYKFEGITYYFIDNQEYFSGNTPYGDNHWDIEKFIFFDKAVLSMLPLIDFKPDIIHCHDWQTGFIPVYLRNEFQADSFFWGIKSIMTIHNLKFQGIYDIDTIQGLSGVDYSLFTSDKLEFRNCGNMLKGGLVYADYVTTVSDTYALEIQTQEYGEGLEGLLSARRFDMQGIVNGIDYSNYNPETDEKLYVNYNLENWRINKATNKACLQRSLGLEVDNNKFMIGLVSRLTDQKGLDLINHVMEEIIDENTQFVIIGTGEPQYENMFRHYAWKYPNRVSANICYNDELARKLYAAADAFLMPSRFEPCGLTQLISFRHGTVPIVRETGGLKDTVIPYNEYDNTGDGFSFSNYNAHEMLSVINYAKRIFFNNKSQWDEIVDRGMEKDFSWNSSRSRYEGLYNYLIGE